MKEERKPLNVEYEALKAELRAEFEARLVRMEALIYAPILKRLDHLESFPPFQAWHITRCSNCGKPISPMETAIEKDGFAYHDHCWFD